jgi:hypothetical protein
MAGRRLILGVLAALSALALFGAAPSPAAADYECQLPEY